MPHRQPLVSIVICLHVLSDRFFSDLNRFRDLAYKNIEILLITNKPTKFVLDQKTVRVIVPAKSHLSLSEKRNIGLKYARGTYIAYIDDDAYPRKDWITRAIRVFETEKNVGAVGGPNITPPDDPYWARIGGRIFESYLTSGGQQWRFLPLGRRDVSELQGVNMIFPKTLLQRIKGFRSKLYSGDDSVVCSDIRKLGYRVISDGEVIVYHHRRSYPFDHLRQLLNMGTHRGNFVRTFPETLAPVYFLPLILTTGFVLGLCLSFISQIRMIYGALLLGFFLLGYSTSIRYAGFGSALIVSVGIITTHLVYGFGFIKGLFMRNLKK